MDLLGIDLNKDVKYLCSSFRYFAENEHHVTRYCNDNVLLLVFDGVLRFGENGVQHEVHAGEYYIQRHNCYQTGELVSTCPKYLYVHFQADWTDTPPFIPSRGKFDPNELKEDMQKMNDLCYSDAPYLIKAAQLYKILSVLAKEKPVNSPARKIAGYLSRNYSSELSLDALCKEFAFSKNHIIQIFKKEFGQTPIAYLNALRLRIAEQMLIATSESTEAIAIKCGYRNYSHFYRQFVRRYGLSPQLFRIQKRLPK